MDKKKLIRLPVLFDSGGDLSKNWYIEFYVRNPRTNKLERQRIKQGINSIHTLKGRHALGENLIKEWSEKLRNGWTPYNDKNVVYDDNLEFQTFIKNYRKLKSKNGTFRYFASKFVDWIKSTVEESTVSTYRSKLRLFDAWLEGNDLNEYDVSVITHDVMVKFFRFIIDERKLSGTSIKKYRQTLSLVFNFVRKERKQYINPCFDLPDSKRINDNTPLPIQEYDIEIFKELIEKKDPQLWMAIGFVYYCFTRPGKELRLLKIGDIDFGRGTIRVNAINSKTVERNIGVPSVFLQRLKHDYNLQSYSKKLYVFSKDGLPGETCLGKNNLRYRFVKFRIETGLPDMYKFYSWKHTGNVRAEEAGISIRDLQKQNGHSSIRTTENYLKNKKSISSQKVINEFPVL